MFLLAKVCFSALQNISTWEKNNDVEFIAGCKCAVSEFTTYFCLTFVKPRQIIVGKQILKLLCNMWLSVCCPMLIVEIVS